MRFDQWVGLTGRQLELTRHRLNLLGLKPEDVPAEQWEMITDSVRRNWPLHYLLVALKGPSHP